MKAFISNKNIVNKTIMYNIKFQLAIVFMNLHVCILRIYVLIDSM